MGSGLQCLSEVDRVASALEYRCCLRDSFDMGTNLGSKALERLGTPNVLAVTGVLGTKKMAVSRHLAEIAFQHT